MTDELELVGEAHTLRFCARTARLVSLRSHLAADQELIASGANTPVFTVQHLDAARQYRQLTSTDAIAEVTLRRDGADRVLEARFTQTGGLDLDVTVVVRANPDEPLSRWSLAIDNRADLEITDVQFPFVVAPYDLAGAPGSEALVWPLGAGMLMTGLHPEDLQPDHPHTWQFVPENTDTDHYPGYTFAQFLAYYNDRAGIYIACEDAEGRIKRFKPVHHGTGIRLGISHVGDWPRAGGRTLEYDTVVGTFTGDWTDAATIYRDWSLQQPWARTSLRERTDVPEWLLDSPPHLMLRIQGEIDDGPTEAIEEFLPYTRALEPLDRLEQRLDSPLVPVLMGWERPGPWIYPDCFPPVGGEEAMREFAGLVRSRGWHLGSFCNGTRWVTGHYWSGYDGREYFADNDGAGSVCRLPDGEPWQEFWDATWRPSHPCCVGVPATRETALAFVKNLLDIGFDWIQFFDQNVGACAFPCYANGHGHPPLPGLWMTEHLEQLLESFRELAGEETRPVVFSVEGPVNEFFLQEFQMADIRSSPPGHRPLNASLNGLIPLYHFLYHELILMHGGFGSAPDPHHLEIRTAYNFVLGEIVGAVMHHDGTLMSKDTALWWARRDSDAGDDSAILGLLASATELRRGIGRDFLVTGRMTQSPVIDDLGEICWEEQGRAHRIPAVFHAAWESADLRYAVALANWTADEQELTVTTPRLRSEATLHIVNNEGVEAAVLSAQDESVRVVLPPRTCALLEAGGRG